MDAEREDVSLPLSQPERSLNVEVRCSGALRVTGRAVSMLEGMQVISMARSRGARCVITNGTHACMRSASMQSRREANQRTVKGEVGEWWSLYRD